MRAWPRVLLPAVIAMLVTGCADGPPPEVDEPVVFIGVDSADWTWIDPLIEAGRMPNLQGLIEQGTRGPLRSLEPLDKSPTIWTTIATGKRPVEHGVVGFIDRGGAPSASDMRTAVTYWEILGHLGRRQAVLGWWVTHPAPPLNGVLVSDFLPYFDLRTKQGEDAAYPPQEWEALAPHVVHPEDVDDAMLARFVDEAVWRAHGDDADALLADLRAIVAGDLTYLAMAEALLARGGFDVFTVYFRGLDLVSHDYWRWFEPRYSGLEPEDWRVRMLGSVIDEYHVFVDELIGRVLDGVDPRSRVLVVSDHGFVGHRRVRGRRTLGVQMHRLEGLVVMKGPGLRRGHVLEGGGVKDVMPTVLALCGVPPARDLDGVVLHDAFTADLRRWSGVLVEQSIASYEGIVPRTGREAEPDPEAEAATLEKLRALGYVD
ncbi:MAG TPA: alkaline phosphatase family protein [Candidatus Krumholzibacteria bacterium]|nr:alkaline phosphatase family protein [Candidatus Krumholzibacteria bacterium]